MKLYTKDFFIILILIVTSVCAQDHGIKPCSGSICPGPTKFYEELNCRPVYKSPNICCPYKYSCDKLYNRSPDKCYINGHIYNLEERLRKEDKNPCDICSCGKNNDGVAQFQCAIIDCFFIKPAPGCYVRKNATQCCQGPVVCPKKPEDRPTCNVDGKIILDGEPFKPVNEPKKNCFCGPNYKGKNIEPFCVTPVGGVCKTELRERGNLQKKCAPVYDSDQSPQSDCNYKWRCQNLNDRIIKNPSSENPSVNCEKQPKCIFGNLKLNIGDKLNRATGEDSVCVDCVCEIPPVLTCKQLSSDICNDTFNPKITNETIRT